MKAVLPVREQQKCVSVQQRGVAELSFKFSCSIKIFNALQLSTMQSISDAAYSLLLEILFQFLYGCFLKPILFSVYSIQLFNCKALNTFPGQGLDRKPYHGTLPWEKSVVWNKWVQQVSGGGSDTGTHDKEEKAGEATLQVHEKLKTVKKIGSKQGHPQLHYFMLQQKCQ